MLNDVICQLQNAFPLYLIIFEPSIVKVAVIESSLDAYTVSSEVSSQMFQLILLKIVFL